MPEKRRTKIELTYYINKGEEAAGGRTALAELLDIRPNQITDAKRKGLPISACFQLAELIEQDAKTVIAASELITEKRPERVAILLRFIKDK